MIFTIPNVLSVLRILLVAVFCIIYSKPDMLVYALIVLIISGISDVLDGYIARKYNQISDVGKILDPIADKLFQISTILCLVISGAVPVWAIIIVCIKELTMLIGSLVYYNKCDVVLSAKWYGKASSAMFFSCFVIVFIFQIINKSYNVFTVTPYAPLIINIIFAITIGLSVYSTVSYIILAVKTYNGVKAKKKETNTD